MKPSLKIKNEIDQFKAVTWSNNGDPEPADDDPTYIEPGWVKFGVEKSELGWRTLEFIAWVCNDMCRSGERLEFFPTSPPPYLNEPGECLSFVIEVHPKNNDQDERFSKVSKFIGECRKKYWDECKP